jgi:tripartite-type tricarboxylate transporter receptor subunit TctC
VRAHAVTTATRAEMLRDVPSIGEFVPGYVATGWYGIICAPEDTPAVIIDKLNASTTAGVANPKFKARLLALGVVPRVRTPAEFAKFIADETEKWAKVTKFAGIIPEVGRHYKCRARCSR